MTRLDTQKGQVLVMSALVMAFLFLPLSVFVIDTALVDSSYAQLGETLQASAEDGASSIDVAAYRSSNGQIVRLDPVQAKAVADGSIKAAAVPGLQVVDRDSQWFACDRDRDPIRSADGSWHRGVERVEERDLCLWAIGQSVFAGARWR